MSNDMFSSVNIGDLKLTNRMVMAPMTRNRANEHNAPHELNVTYYKQRASAGLIITEASQVSADGVGYPGTPGIYSDEQVAGWQEITDVAIYDNLGNIIDRQSFHSNGGYTYKWDLRNENGIKVASGIYVAIIRYQTDDGSVEMFKRMIGVKQ